MQISLQYAVYGNARSKIEAFRKRISHKVRLQRPSGLVNKLMRQVGANWLSSEFMTDSTGRARIVGRDTAAI
jgi:hypothetical protein